MRKTAIFSAVAAGLLSFAVPAVAATVSQETVEFYQFPKAEEPEYEGPDPVAVWVAGEFDDDRSAHGELEVSLNGNTTNALGEIVIGGSTTLGATIAIPDGLNSATMLVKYEIPSGGAPAANSVPVSVFATKEMGALAGNASSDLEGYWLNGSATAAGYAFSSSAPSIPLEGYLLISVPANSEQNPGNHYTAVYVGETVAAMSGGEASSLRFTGPANRVTSIGIGGPTIAGAVPWAGMVIKSVALFDEWVTPADLANYKFPEQGAVLPEDSDRYLIEPVAKWVNDFKTTEKNGCTLSVSGTTAAKDDSFGGILTVGNAAAVIDVTSTNALTVLVKYRAAPDIQSAPVVTFGGQAAVTFDSGICTDTNVARQLSAYYSFIYSNSRRRGIYAVDGNPTLSSDGGYLVCARKMNACLAYVGDSLDNMTGGECTTDMTLSNSTLRKIGIGGQTELSNNDANMVPFTGFVVEKVVVFNGYYTPDQIRYVPNPEDGETLSIADGATWNFAAGTTRTYTSIGTLSASGTIAVTNASGLAEGSYMLATWTTPQIMSSGYGRVGTLTAEGLPSSLTAELVYGVKAIYLRVYDAAAYAARPKFKIMPYGDSITEGFNLGNSKANYRVLLGQKLAMLGYNVEMVGCYNKIQSRYGTDSFFDAIDPSGAVATNIWQRHSAKHGATLGVTALTSWQRSALKENVDTISAMAGKPDVVLLLGGINDLSPGFDAPATVFANWTNVVSRLVKNLPDTKIVVTTTLHAGPGRTDSLNTNADNFNTLVKNYLDDMPAAWSGHVYFVDLCDAVKSAETGVISSDNLHPDWLGDDQMADGWLSVITNLYPSADGTFPSSTPLPAVSSGELGAAAKSELADYMDGYSLCRTITPTGNIDTSNPYSATGNGVTENIEKVAYFVEYVRADNNAHKWVWVDMDAFGDCDLASVGLPSANRQQVVTKLHVKSNHNGIDDVAASDDTVCGWIEFSPYDYAGDSSGVEGAPLRHGAATGNYTMFDWDDTLSSSGSMGSMQVFRKATPSGRSAQVLFAYNNWRSSASEAEFGIGNFAQHFWGGAQTLDYTYTAGLEKMNASAYSVKRIEIWTKGATPAYVRDNIVKRADGTVYHGNDENRAIITNWQCQITRPAAPPAPNTIDILYVLDKPSREYIEETKNMPLDEFFARETAFMNEMLCRTDMDTNFWFRMVGVYPLDVGAQEVSPMLGRSKNSSEAGFELVNEVRNRVGADIVFSVARNGGGIGGLAFVNSYENIVSGAAAPNGHACGLLDYYDKISWIHEIAHVMSCNHNPPENIDVTNPRHRQFGAVVHDDNATEEPFYYRTIMTGWYYAGQTWCFSSRNHYYNGVQLSVSNHVDATQVMVELAPYVAQWYPTKVPQSPEIGFFPQDNSEIPAGVETKVAIDYGDPEAEIYWYDVSGGEGKADAHLYTGPISLDGEEMKMLYAFAKTNGVEVADSEKSASYFPTGTYGRFDYSVVLDSDGIAWSMPNGDSSEFGWDKDMEVFCTGDSSYRAHVDMESLTNSRPSTCSATAMLTLSETKNLNFRHRDSYTNAMFSVWLDDVPVYYKNGASDTGGEWRKEVVRIEPGTHRLEFIFTQTAEDRVDAQTSEGDGHELVDDVKYRRYVASLAAAETSRVWIDGFEWTPADLTWAGDAATGDGVWSTDASYTPWEGEVPFADDAVITFPDLASGSATVSVKGEVRPGNVRFTGANTSYAIVPQDDGAFIYIGNGSSIEFKTNAAIRVPFRLDAAQIKSAASRTLELGNVFGNNLGGPGSQGVFSGQIAVNSKSTVVMNPGAGRVQTVGDFGKNWSYKDSDLVFTNGTVKVNGAINGGAGLFQYKRIHVKDGAVLELVTNDATGYDVADSNTLEVECGGELKIDAGDRLRRPLRLSGGKLTVSRSGSVHALALYNSPSFAVTADSVLSNGNASASLGFVGQDATITLQNNATLDCYVPFANGIMDGDGNNVTIAGSGTFVQNAIMVQFTNKVTVANGVTFRQNALVFGALGRISWDVYGTLEANAAMMVNALTLASGATLSVKVTEANVSEAALQCGATPSLAGAIMVDADSGLASGKYAVISAAGLDAGILERVSSPALAGRAAFAVEEGGLFMTVKDAVTDSDYPTPYSWIDTYFPELVSGWGASQYNDFATNMNHSSVKNGYAPWESYVLGLDPTNEVSKFMASIRMDGTTPIVEYSPTNETLKASGEIEYVLQGKPALANGWQDVRFDEPGDTNRFFRVKVTWRTIVE